MNWFTNLNISKKIGGGFAVVTLLLIILSLLAISGIEKSEETNLRVIELRQPTVLASTELENGINHSLAALRGWMILSNPKMKEQRQKAWHEIEESLAKMKAFSKNWTNSENIKRLDSIEKHLATFSIAQLEIENISGTIRQRSLPGSDHCWMHAKPLR